MKSSACVLVLGYKPLEASIWMTLSFPDSAATCIGELPVEYILSIAWLKFEPNAASTCI